MILENEVVFMVVAFSDSNTTSGSSYAYDIWFRKCNYTWSFPVDEKIISTIVSERNRK